MKAHESGSPSSLSEERSWSAWLAWLATEDHCAWANRYVYWLKTPLGILLSCVVFSLLCGLFVAPQVLVLLAVLVVVILVGVAWPKIAVRGLRCRLVFAADRGREGKPTRAKLIVTNRWPWPVWGLAVDDPAFACATEAGGPVDATQVALARIDGWSRNSYHWTFVPPRRGVYPSREVRVVTGFPFGLTSASRPVEVERKLVVWPDAFWLPPLNEVHDRRCWSGELCESHTGTDGARLGVRDYRQGDSLRDVHWAKSARHERLIVSEREATVMADYKVIVDVDASHHTEDGDLTLEWSLRIAASICESVVGQNGRVELWLGGDRHVAGVGGDSLERLLDGVARLVPNTEPTAIHASPLRGFGDNHVVSVGTDASESLVGRRIVLQLAAFAKQQDQHPNRDGWIDVASPTDVPGQVLKGWRRPKRRLLGAS